MKSVWIKADTGSWEEKKQRITAALESGVDCILASAEDVDKIRELGSIKIAAPSPEADILLIRGEGDGTHPLPEDFKDSKDFQQAQEAEAEKACYVVIRDKRYEEFAAFLGGVSDYLVVIGTDWKVIPLENLIAGLQKLDVEIIAGVQNAEEAKLALETLEHGSDGVLLDTDNPSEIKKVVAVRDESQQVVLELKPARVTRVKPLGMGDRVCVDTCSLLGVGEGMLVGSQSNGLFLVHAESEESEYVAARPFRVNAGPVHAYIKTGEKTRYLSELGAGDEVTVVDSKGRTRTVIVGRVKIERRPLMLVEAEVNGKIIKTILQNAETIKLVSPDGWPVSVAELKEGDEVLVHYEEVARHFGMGIEETIIEK